VDQPNHFMVETDAAKRHYPNYFLDTRVFVDLLNQIIAPAPKPQAQDHLPAGEDSAAGT
jgi:hypothetical protein